MMIPMVLKLDVSGVPVKWISWQEAAVLYVRELIAWTAGEHNVVLHGGHNRSTGLQSVLTINSIVAIKSHQERKHKHRAIPPLTNKALFLRDRHLCLYCGEEFREGLLTRDHVTPLSRGGLDSWSNVVTACQACNTRKGAHKPEEARMQLLAIPFVPNHAEFLALSNRRIMSDQMAFLQKQFSKKSRMIS
jgi:5-methylcytosine-specific restriction endonuclease McrA